MKDVNVKMLPVAKSAALKKLLIKINKLESVDVNKLTSNHEVPEILANQISVPMYAYDIDHNEALFFADGEYRIADMLTLARQSNQYDVVKSLGLVDRFQPAITFDVYSFWSRIDKVDEYVAGIDLDEYWCLVTPVIQGDQASEPGTYRVRIFNGKAASAVTDTVTEDGIPGVTDVIGLSHAVLQLVSRG